MLGPCWGCVQQMLLWHRVPDFPSYLLGSRGGRIRFYSVCVAAHLYSIIGLLILLASCFFPALFWNIIYKVHLLRVYSSAVFIIFTRLCSHHCNLNFRAFSSPSKKTSFLLASTPQLPQCSISWNHWSTLCLCWSLLDISCKWNTMNNLWCLTSCAQQ